MVSTMTPALKALPTEPVHEPVTLTDTESGAYVWWETVTPERAAELLERNTENRTMRDRSVSAYTRDMEAGRWVPTGDTIKIANTGEVIDGQHRLQAIVTAQLPVRLLIVSGLPLEARTVIDTGAARTGGDALRLHGITGGHAETLAAAARTYRLWETGALTHMTTANRGRDRVTHAELLATVKDVPDLLDAVKDAQRDYARIGIPAGPQAMVRSVLYRIDAKDAERFFSSLAGYATDGPNDPRAVLLYTIRNMRSIGQLRRPGESVGLTFAAWNAWRDGQSITSLSTHNRDGKPARIPEPL